MVIIIIMTWIYYQLLVAQLNQIIIPLINSSNHIYIINKNQNLLPDSPRSSWRDNYANGNFLNCATKIVDTAKQY